MRQATSLADYTGRRLFLVFVQAGCGPCHAIVPDLNRLHRSGKASVLFGGLDLEAAQQWVAGAQSVPLHCQDGLYVHRQDLEGTTYLRVYQRGSDPACIVRIRF